MQIKLDDLSGVEVKQLLLEHLRDMEQVSPPESRHALDLQGLKGDGITFWSVWDGSLLAACGALKELDAVHGELKSMRTSREYRRKGVGVLILQHIIAEAAQRGYRRLSLETGSMDYFIPARRLYAKFGFEDCGPFASYVEDPNSVFMTKHL